MSTSDPNSKIDIIEDPKIVRKKVNSAYCAPGDIKDNGLLSFLQYVVQPIQELKAEKEGVFSLDIDRPEKYGGPISYDCMDKLKADFESGVLSPVDLKSGVADRIIELLAPIKAEYDATPEFQLAQQNGYPVAQPKQEKKVKKAKNKGSRYPGSGPTPNSVEEATAKLDDAKLE